MKSSSLVHFTLSTLAVIAVLWVVVTSGSLLASEPRHSSQTTHHCEPGDTICYAVSAPRRDLAFTRQILSKDTDQGDFGAGGLVEELREITTRAGAGLGDVLRLNVHLADTSDEKYAAAEKMIAEHWPRGRTPAVTFIPGRLPEDASLACDAVFVLDASSHDLRAIHQDVEDRVGVLDAVVAPARRDLIFASGRVGTGASYAESIPETIKLIADDYVVPLGATLRDVIQVRAYVGDLNHLDDAAAMIAQAFAPRLPPPIVFVQWSKLDSVEIEFVIAGPPSDRSLGGVSFFTPPGLSASPVFSRVATVHSDRIIFFSGMLGTTAQSPMAEVTSLFDTLAQRAVAVGSDLRHLVKATYLVSDTEVDRAVTTVRPKYFDPDRPPAASKIFRHTIGPADRHLLVDMIAVPLVDQHPQGTFQLAPGFRVELVASEPLIRDPIAAAFDEDGRLFVIEYPEYNQQFASVPEEVQGHVRLLTDTNGDGVFDESEIYVAGLAAPSAIACYDGGVFVASAPDVWFCKDTNGDGKADLRQRVFTGFRRMENRTDPSLNSFRWGIDHRFHACTSFSGAEVRTANQDESESISAGQRRFLFDPRSLQIDLSSGGGQHGLAFDDWGRAFTCANSSPVRYMVYDDRYLQRNPYVEAQSPTVEILSSGKETKLFRLSPEEAWRVERTRLRVEGIVRGSAEGGKSSGFFTAASGITIYRGDAWPPAYRGNVFVGEAANNLVFRARVSPSGVSRIADRADEDFEFLASTSTRFRPVQFVDGPDGNLYVIDMHRELIEGGMFLPPEILRQVDVNGGSHQGRIYRLVPTDYQPREFQPLGQAGTEDLVAVFEHPNGWHRDTASRLLYQRQDQKATQPLRKLVHESEYPVARATALYALQGLASLDTATLRHALDDPTAEVRRHAIRLADNKLADDATLQVRLLQMVDDDDVDVRFQLAFTLGELRPSESRQQALVRLFVKDGHDPWFRLAIQSSLADGAAEMFRDLARQTEVRDSLHGQKFLESLARQIATTHRRGEVERVVESIESWHAEVPSLVDRILVALLERRNADVREFLQQRAGTQVQTHLQRLLRDAERQALDTMRKPEQRVAAISRLSFIDFNEAQVTFARLLEPQQASAVQNAAIETLSAYRDGAIAELLLQRWPTMTPGLRAGAMETLLSRPAWSHTFLDAVEQGRIGRGDLDPARIELLKQHPRQELADRAAAVFADQTMSRRADVVEAYQVALDLPGDALRGREMFRKACAACHQLEGVGHTVGADLKAIRDQGKAAILLNILDPNREVKPQYQSYTVVTESGRVIAGMIVQESVNSIKIRQSDATEVAVLRVDIDQLRSSGLSFMPEGIEQQINPQAMADLLAYLMSPQHAEPTTR